MRCAVYARVSTEMETQKTSIAHQISFFEKYITDKGWQLYQIYQDIESGTSIKHRDGLKQLIRDSQKGMFDIVLTKSISRFARNTLEGLQLARDLKEKDIRLITIEDGFDSEEYDEFMFTLLLSIAQKESEKMSQRIQFGKQCRAKNGYYNGSTPPYGYRKIDKYNIKPAEDISKYVVQKIFKMYLQGSGVYKIAKELNEQGYPTPSQTAGKSTASSVWHQSTIRKILSNRFYMGDMLQNKSTTRDVLTGKRQHNKYEEYIVVENSHTGIIDKKTFEEVQQKLNKRKKEKQGSHQHLFSNLLICGQCESGMHYKKEKKAYICGKTNKMGKIACCGSYIREDDLMKIITNELESMFGKIISSSDFKSAIRETWSRDVHYEEKEELERLIKKNTQKMDKILNLFMDNSIDKETFQKKRKELESECKILESKELQLMNYKEEDLDKQERRVHNILQLKEIDYLFLHKLINKIKIIKDNEVEISFNFHL